MLYIYIGLVDVSDFFINRELKLGLKFIVRLIIEIFLYDFKKLVFFNERDIFKIVLLL